MGYAYKEYWSGLHREHVGDLRGVGHPHLCKALNGVKYRSESETVLQSLMPIGEAFKERGKSALSVLDVGAGIGYWSETVNGYLRAQGFSVHPTALDISTDALETIRRRDPHIHVVQEDLTTIDPASHEKKYDLVVSCYCIHHLVNLEDFLNALEFMIRSVKRVGALLLVDPILTMPYSRFDVIDFCSFTGNGVPRHLYLYDDVLAKHGFKRQSLVPAVSFLLNGNIEARGSLCYSLSSVVWRALSVSLYRSDRLTQALSGLLLRLDRLLKTRNLSFSSSVCCYTKFNAAGPGGPENRSSAYTKRIQAAKRR